jgi:diguanylate cyclase (GGDEF)-like protein/PAS domain S-box-containing protein
MTTDDRLPLPKVMDLLLDAICVVDEHGRYVFVNAAWERLLGYTREEMLGRNMIDLVFPEDRERTLQAAANVMSGNPHLHFENRYLHKDGRVVHIMWSARWSETERLRLAVARDITELKRIEAMQRALYRISEAAHEAGDLPELCRRVHGIVGDLLSAENFVIALYDEPAGMLSFPYFVDEREAAPQAQPLAEGTPLAEVIRTGQPLLRAGEDGSQWLGVPLICPKGLVGALAVQSHRGPARYSEEDKGRLQFLSSGIAAELERKQAEAHLLHQVTHDALTGLPNRTLFDDRFDNALRRARRYGEHLALLYLDLDGFKQVNDSCGHEAGDRLLCEVAQRLAGCVRASDTVARMGGDEFTVLLTNIHGPQDAERVAEKLRVAIAAPFALDGRSLSVSASIGSAVFPEDGEEREPLFRRADAGMYAAKRG